jgi:recombinational DNA repair protein (RecF pathway)
LNIQSTKIIEVNFLAKFLKILGFSPNIHECINCQKKLSNQKNIYFDKERWGFCCGDCSVKNQESISWQLFKSIAILIELPLNEIIQQELNDPIELRYKDVKTILQKYIKQIKKYF